MNLEYVPLLEIQRDLYRIPRGLGRFNAYIRTMVREDGTDLDRAPLAALNPMAREHVADLLDALLELGAEVIGSRAASEGSARLADLEGNLKVGLVVADDRGGGWTNRVASEFGFMTGGHSTRDRGWLSGVLWSSESASERSVREAVLVPLFRWAYIHRHGKARTLAQFMAQEGDAMARAGCLGPTLDDEELDYTRQILEPDLGETLPRTIMECLFGDEGGRTLGFTPRGLGHRAGLALALHQASTRTGVGPTDPKRP
ncbi:hypothetical protein P12x_002853 [Tundrisphaera lichenicola]|uniref:hypothetical protein n=1 Tax=Tundrisphaera lichenicola TaxID=2029860 RepID=UPI003EBBAC50